jgi:hypothetical protein
MDGQGSISGRGQGFFSSHNIQTGCGTYASNSYLGLFPGGLSDWGVKLNTHVHLVLRSRMLEIISTPPYVFMVWWLIN